VAREATPANQVDTEFLREIKKKNNTDQIERPSKFLPITWALKIKKKKEGKKKVIRAN
jgi:hypothetical protein